MFLVILVIHLDIMAIVLLYYVLLNCYLNISISALDIGIKLVIYNSFKTVAFTTLIISVCDSGLSSSRSINSKIKDFDIV